MHGFCIGMSGDALGASEARRLVVWTFRPMEHEPLTVSTLQLGDLAGILRRRIKLIAVTTLAVLALAVTYLLLATPQYTAFTEILIDPRKKNTVENEVIPSGLGTTASINFALVDSQVGVITSDAVLRPVVKSQDLVADPEFQRHRAQYPHAGGAIRPEPAEQLVRHTGKPSFCPQGAPQEHRSLARQSDLRHPDRRDDAEPRRNRPTSPGQSPRPISRTSPAKRSRQRRA